MATRLTALALCGALAALAGCGSSSSSSSVSSSSSSTAASTPKTSSTSGTTSTSGSSLEVNVKPKFAKATGPVRSGTVQIAYRNIAIEPDTVRVKVGSKVVWTNYDNVEHNVTSEGGPQHFSSGNFGEGHQFSITVNTPGVLHYECTNHPASMNGTVEVVD
jgi:plastocyanin